MRKTIVTAAALICALGGDAAAQQAQTHRSCFFVTQLDQWRAPDAKTIYIRVNVNRFYRLDLGNECSRLQFPDTHLIMNVRGPDTICSAVDWDLKVSESGPGAIATPCIVKAMTELTPGEVLAIPPKFRP